MVTPGGVPLEGELHGRAHADDGQHRQQHEVQAVAGEQRPGALQPGGEDEAGPGQPEQPQQPEQSKRTQHRNRDHQQVDEVMPGEPPAGGREVQLDQVLDREDRPDQVIDGVEGAGQAGRDPDRKRDHQDRQPEHGQDGQRHVDRGGEPVVRVLRSPKLAHGRSPGTSGEPCWHTWETRRLRAGNARVNSGVCACGRPPRGLVVSRDRIEGPVLSGNVPGTVRA
jgi:hypothetical protein